MNQIKIREILRGLLLPIPLNIGVEAITIVTQFLTEEGIAEEDQATYLKNLVEEWHFDAHVNPVLERLVKTVFEQTDQHLGVLFADKYFELHTYLCEQPFISFELASIALSHLRHAFYCSVYEKMSSSKINITLASIDTRLDVLRWQNIQYVLRKLGVMPDFSQEDVELLYADDVQMAEYHFADATMHEASDMLGEIATSLRFPGELENYLKQLIEDGATHKPYLQILHYQCTISAFYDHVLSNAYEFSPRGNKATWLFNQWELPTGNPILNNAKAIDILNYSWANGRKPNEYPAAKVLVDILSRMDQMGFAASQELAAWLRRWLVRYIELYKVKTVPVLLAPNHVEAMKLLNAIASNETNTYGILEQRMMDIVCSAINNDENFVPRGMGDSVNANNLSKGKLGDCDFQNSTSKQIMAYEAHGGKLTAVYLEGHVRTLRRSLMKRSNELDKIAEPRQWEILITFVAYEFDVDLPEPMVIDGYTVSFEFVTFIEFLSRVNLPELAFMDLFQNHFVEPVNAQNTPQFVRDKILELLN